MTRSLLTLDEIAERILRHLLRFESDPEINAPHDEASMRGLRPYFDPRVWSSGRLVYITYLSYHHAGSLSKTSAERYLRWLDEGNVGRHYEALRGELIGRAWASTGIPRWPR